MPLNTMPSKLLVAKPQLIFVHFMQFYGPNRNQAFRNGLRTSSQVLHDLGKGKGVQHGRRGRPRLFVQRLR